MIKIVNGVEISLDDDEISQFNAQSAALKQHLVRNERNKLLRQSDVYALVDKVTDEWITYRQALRDVPSQDGFPTSVNWPTKP